MKRKHHISASSLLAVAAAVREFYGEVPGTGQSLMELLRDGWGYLEIHRYFPWEAVNWVLLIGAGVWFACGTKSGQR